jgi:hypothetical protein
MNRMAESHHLTGLCALAGAVVCLGVAACGSAGGKGTAGAATRTGASAPPRDRDNDGDRNDDDNQFLFYGSAASAVERRDAVALLKRYYAASAAANGGEACSLLVPLLASLIVEEDGKSPGLVGNTCAAVVSKLLECHHRELSEKRPALTIYTVRVKGDRRLILIEFPAIRREMRQIGERLVGGKWRIDRLFDSFLE